MAQKPKSRKPSPETSTGYLSTADAAKYLGVPPRSLRNYVVRRLIPRRMVGASLVFVRDELDTIKGKVPMVRGRKKQA